MTPYYDDGGGRQIFFGDCRQILPTLPKADLCLTDPPYVIKHVDGGGIGGARAFYKQDALAGIRDFILSDFESVLSAANALIAFHSRDQIYDYADFSRRCFKGYDLHFWHKVNPVPFTNNTWLSDVEYLTLAWRGTKKHQPVEMKLKSKMYQSGLETGSLHPTQKPLPLMVKYLRVLKPDFTVDPFMGSGTTLVAAKSLGLACTGIELEEKYCEIAARRLQQSVFDFEAPPIKPDVQSEVNFE